MKVHRRVRMPSPRLSSFKSLITPGGGSGFNSSTHLERLYEGPQESADALSSTEQFHEPHNSRGGGGVRIQFLYSPGKTLWGRQESADALPRLSSFMSLITPGGGGGGPDSILLLTWKDFMKVHRRVRMPSPRLSSFTSLITRNKRKKLILIIREPLCNTI